VNYSETAKVTSKGQVTIPVTIREILKLEQGSTIMFKLTKNGVLLSPCELTERPAYTVQEWGKIEKMVAERGKVYKTSKSAKKHLDSL